MIILAHQHPVQLVLGSMLIQADLAQRDRQLTFGVIAQDCIGWAVEVRDVLSEIATDAEYGAQRLNAAAADGVLTQAEAREGKIIR